MTFKTIGTGKLIFTADAAINHKFSDETLEVIRSAVEDAVNTFSMHSLLIGESKIEILYDEVKK